MFKVFRASMSAVLATVALVGATSVASAAPPTAAFSGTAAGNVVAVDVALEDGTLDLANVRLANSEASGSSTATPRSESVSRNLAATVAGLAVDVASNTQIAPPDNGGPVTGTLATVDALGIGARALTTSNEAHWSGDDSCVDEVLADSTTRTAGISVDPAGPADILSTGVSSTRSTAALVSAGGAGDNRAVQSTAVGTIADVSLLDGAVTVEVEGDATLTATADGTTGGADVTYDAPVVRVTANGLTTTVDLDDTTTVDVGALGQVVLTVNNPTETVDPAGLSASASVSVVSLEIRAGSAAEPVATANIDLLPLTVAVEAPAGGIDCDLGAPELTTPADGAVLMDNTPTYTGTGVPGATINLTVDGDAVTTVITVDTDGTWEFTPTTALADGPHMASATQTADGETSPASGTNDFTIDTLAPAPPVVVTPANNSTTNDTTPTISGTGPANTDIQVYVDGEPIGIVTTDDAGNWTTTAPTLTEDVHTTYAVAVDEAGNRSDRSNTNSFTIDATDPDAPVIVTPADESSTNDTTPTIVGTGEPGASVAISIDGTVVGTAVVDADSSFELPLTTPLGEDPHTVTAVQTDAGGNVSDPAENDFTVDLTAPAAPVLTTPADGSSTADSTPPFTGTTEPGADVEVIVDGKSIGTTTADGTGAFTLTPNGPIPDGSHTAYVVATDAAGNRSEQSNTNTFTIKAPAAPVITSPTNGSTTTDTTPTVTGTAEPGNTVTVLIDGAPVGTAVAGPDGAFTLTLQEPLPSGDHVVTAYATDPAGDRSADSAEVRFSVAVVDEDNATDGGGNNGNNNGGNTNGGNNNGGNNAGGNLASTGGPQLWILGIGGALLIAGASTLTVRRRRLVAGR